MPTFRITSPTIALIHEDGRHVAHIVPTGAIITIEDGTTFDGNKLMNVVWAGLKVMMFTQDLRERTKQVN